MRRPIDPLAFIIINFFGLAKALFILYLVFVFLTAPNKPSKCYPMHCSASDQYIMDLEEKLTKENGGVPVKVGKW